MSMIKYIFNSMNTIYKISLRADVKEIHKYIHKTFYMSLNDEGFRIALRYNRQAPLSLGGGPGQAPLSLGGGPKQVPAVAAEQPGVGGAQ